MTENFEFYMKRKLRLHSTWIYYLWFFFVKNNWFNTLNSESGSKCSVDLGKGTFRRNVPLISTENFGSVVFKVLSKNRGRIPWKFVRNPPLKSKEVLKYGFKGGFRRNRRKIPVPSVLKYRLSMFEGFKI